jgi:ABC-type sugar transport system ATPase subunit
VLPLDGTIGEELVPGRKVVFGIRPEHIRPARPGDDRERLISLSPDRYELVGSQGLLRFQVDASPLMMGDPRAEVAAEGDVWTNERPSTLLARVEADHDLVPDVGVDLYLDVARAHLFDPETELAIR